MAYDEYKDIPKDYIPTRADENPLFDIAINVRTAIQIRRDFQTAVRISDHETRRLGKSAPWESEFAKSGWTGSKTPAGLAKRHRELAADAKSRVDAVRGNVKLKQLLAENLRFLFPDIGFDETSGRILQRLQGPRSSVLRIFHPLGVGDFANLIRLLLTRPAASVFYW